MKHLDCWQRCLDDLKNQVSELAFSTWFREIEFISFEDNTILLKSPEVLYIKHIEAHYKTLLTNVCEKNFNKIGLDVIIKLEDEIDTYIQNTPKKDETIKNNLNSQNVFATFVIGESNRFAHAACVAVAEKPGTYNPLFLYGDVGLGKTHLMHAIANHILKENPSSKVLYASCENFTNELISSIREKSNKAFRDRYRRIDVLLIDDIQFIVGKTETQNEFFHTFNDLKEAGKQIIISSDRPPNEIETLTDRLRSRFQGGLTVDIKMPNFETRTAILEKKAQSLHLDVPKEVSQFIAKVINSNIRELEGALTRVVAYGKLMGEDLSVSIAESALRDLPHENVSIGRALNINIDFILELVSNYYAVTIDELKSKKRTQHITLARQIYMYLARDILNESLTNIGRSIKRDHSTVIYGIEKIEDKIKSDRNFEQNIHILREKLLIK